MKRVLTSRTVRIPITAGVVILLSVLFFLKPKAVRIGEIEHFSFSYTCGDTANARVSYGLTLEDGVYTASITPANEPDEAERTFTVEESFARELEQILIRHKVGKWNGFDKADRMVMDGDRFNMFILMTDGTSLNASGYMKWPRAYSEVKYEIEELFGGLIR